MAPKANAASKASTTPLEGALETRDHYHIWRGYFETFDGLNLFSLRWTSDAAEAATGPVVVIMHGLGEHIERYHEVAQHFVDAQLPVVGFDARGHGQSDGRRAFIKAYGDYIQDLRAVVGHAAARYPDRPVVLIGHSNGGLIATRFAQTYPEVIDALILSSPLCGLALAVPAWKSIAGRVLSKYIPTMAMPSDIPPEAVSRTPEVVEAYATDPLVVRVVTTRYFTEMTQAITRAHQAAPTITMPTLVMQAQEDQLVSPEQTRVLFDHLGSADKTFRPLEGQFHEIFNEPERHETFAFTTSWIQEHVGR